MAVLGESAALAMDRQVEATVLSLRSAEYTQAGRGAAQASVLSLRSAEYGQIGRDAAQAGCFIFVASGVVKAPGDQIVSFSYIRLTDAYNTVFVSKNSWA